MRDMPESQEIFTINSIQELKAANTILSVSPLHKRTRKHSATSSEPPQKLSKTKFEDRLNNLLTRYEFGDIFYQKTVLDIHHVIVVNWKVFQFEILEKQNLWGRTKCFSTFNREMLVQGYHKVKFQSTEHSQKVQVFLRALDPRTIKSHIPCFIPVAEIKAKQAALRANSKYRKLFIARSRKRNRKRQRRKTKAELSGKLDTATKLGPSTPIYRPKAYIITELNSGKVECSPKHGPKTAAKTPEIAFRKKCTKTYDRGRASKPPKQKILERKAKVFEMHKANSCQYMLDMLVTEHVKCLLDIQLNDPAEDEEDLLLWDPKRLPENKIIAYLRECGTTLTKEGRIEENGGNSMKDTRHPDNEAVIRRLVEEEYDIDRALKSQQLGKYKVYIEEEKDEPSNEPCDSGFSDPSLSTQSHTDSEISTESDEATRGRFEKEPCWTVKMKLNFEKGLILFGENVDEIREHYRCFSHLKPLNLDLYFYSDERQKFIGNQDVSKKIVDILDQTSLKHLQKIEFFELGRDWARMRQNALCSSSESDESVYVENRYNSFGRTIKSLQRKKKRPRRLPDRFKNFHL